MSDERLLRQLMESNAKLLARLEAMEARQAAAEVPRREAPPSTPVADSSRYLVSTILDDHLASAIRGLKAGSASLKVVTSAVKVLKQTAIPTGAETSKPLGEWYADELNKEIANMYIDARETAGSIARTTAARNLNVLQKALTTYVALGKLVKNPIAKWTRPPTRRRQTCASLPEWKEFIKFGPPMFQDIELVQHLCVGMRPGEARLLMKTELDYQHREITLDPDRTKTGKDRAAISVPDEAWEVIERRVVESRGPYVFVNPRDPTRTQPISDGTMGTWLWKTQKRSGMKGRGGENIVRYSGRHGGITDRIDQGFAPGNVAAMSGTSLEVMQKHYMHLSAAKRAEVREQMNRHGLTPIDGERKRPQKIAGKLPLAVGDE